MRALLRVTSGYKFWEPVNYGEHAQKWAEHDRGRTERFLLALIKKSAPEGRIFYLLLELQGAQEAFWNTEAEEWANKALKPTAH